MESPEPPKSGKNIHRILAELIEDAQESPYGWVIVTLAELLQIREELEHLTH